MSISCGKIAEEQRKGESRIVDRPVCPRHGPFDGPFTATAQFYQCKGCLDDAASDFVRVDDGSLLFSTHRARTKPMAIHVGEKYVGPICGIVSNNIARCDAFEMESLLAEARQEGLPSPDDTLGFGRHAGKSYRWVVEHKDGYCKWGQQQEAPSGELAELVSFYKFWGPRI